MRQDVVELHNGVIIDDYFYWEGGDFVQVFALIREQEVILVRQYKRGVRDIILELPAGMIDAKDSTPEAAARRDPLEETGYQAERFEPLAMRYPNTAKATIRGFGYLAVDAFVAAEKHQDISEHIEIVRCPVETLWQLIAQGKVPDTNSISFTFLALRKLGGVTRRNQVGRTAA